MTVNGNIVVTLLIKIPILLLPEVVKPVFNTSSALQEIVVARVFAKGNKPLAAPSAEEPVTLTALKITCGSSTT
jgi:hypothetical protein